MTDEQKQQIIAMRRDGAGYGRIRDGSGNGSAAMPAGISGGTHIWSW